MRKRLAVIVMLFTMVFSVFILNCGQPMKYIAERDEVIEWHSYSEEGLV